jgi:hypothetical protein
MLRTGQSARLPRLSASSRGARSTTRRIVALFAPAGGGRCPRSPRRILSRARMRGRCVALRARPKNPAPQQPSPPSVPIQSDADHRSGTTTAPGCGSRSAPGGEQARISAITSGSGSTSGGRRRELVTVIASENALCGLGHVRVHFRDRIGVGGRAQCTNVTHNARDTVHEGLQRIGCSSTSIDSSAQALSTVRTEAERRPASARQARSPSESPAERASGTGARPRSRRRS